jgi:hypothetical protein
MAEPFERFEEEQRKQVRGRLSELGILDDEGAAPRASVTH